MSPITPLLGLLCGAVGLLAPIYMALFVWLIKWDSEPSYVPGKGATDPFDPSFAIRGDLPGWLRWAQTCDSRFSGMYEAAITKAYGDGSYLRRTWAAYLWCGFRNRAQGLAAMLGHQTTWYIPTPFSTSEDRTGWTQGGGVWTFQRGADWQQWRKLGPVYLITGHQVYRLQDGTFLAVPVCTFKLALQANN